MRSCDASGQCGQVAFSPIDGWDQPQKWLKEVERERERFRYKEKGREKSSNVF